MSKTLIAVVSELVFVMACSVFPQAAGADLAPTSGTFTGYYHRDRLGVGHFGSFYVAPELHEKLAKHEGKLIRVEIVKAEQPMNPGYAIILAVGRIEELPQPPLKFTIKTRPSPVIEGQPFEVLLQVSDTRHVGAEPNPDGLVPEGILVSFRQPSAQPGPDPNKPSWLFRGYTTRQLAIDAHGGQVEASIWPFPGGRPNLTTSSGRLELLPGNSWTWVLSFSAGVARADGEVHAAARYLIAGETPGEHERTVTPIEAWQHVPVRPAPATRPSSVPAGRILRLGEVKLSFTDEDGWSNLKFTLLPAAGKKVRVPGAVNVLDGTVFPDTYANIGRLEAFQAEGTPVTLQIRRTPDENLPNTARQRFVDLPEPGVVITARFRKDSGFAPEITRLSVSFVTEEGVETLTVSENYRDLDVTPAMPFGPVTDGVKMRIRPVGTTFKAGTALTFYVQAVNTSGKPVCWWKSSGGDGENTIVEIDGKQLLQLPLAKAKYIGGWAAQWTTKNPQDWTVMLPEPVPLTKGRHTLRYTIVSKGGTHMNANQQPIPMVDGQIVSNEAVFLVE